MNWAIYLSGEIHSDWREDIARGIRQKQLPITLLSSVVDHKASDECGAKILGDESNSFWKDHKSAKINAIRNRTLIEKASIVIVRFGHNYRQWNAAFDAGIAATLGKSLITIHDPELDHALKEIDAAALATTRTIEQVIDILEYITIGNSKDS